MFYFLYGNSPMIEFETEKLSKEIIKKFPGKKKKNLFLLYKLIQFL